jgi:hypothetical protein
MEVLANLTQEKLPMSIFIAIAAVIAASEV